MFAIIETNNATHIAIHIPKDGADKSLPAIAAMLEQNATFIRKDWRDLSIVKPVMGITLGDKFCLDSGEEGELLISSSPEVISNDFVIAAPEAFISHKKAMAEKNKELERLRTELQNVRYQLDAANERIKAIESQEEEQA